MNWLKHKKTASLVIKIFILFAAFFVLRPTTPVFADFWQDTFNQASSACGDRDYCYNGSALIWVYAKFTSGKTINLTSQLGPFSASGFGYPQGGLNSSIDCSAVPGAEGAYILAETWFRVRPTPVRLSGYFYPVVEGQTKGSFANFDSRYLTTSRLSASDAFEYPLGTSSKWGYYYPHWGSGDASTHLVYDNDSSSYAETDLNYVYERYKNWKDSADADKDWQIGDFNYFCGSDKPVGNYQSKTNVHDPATGATVSSGYNDTKTDEILDLGTVTPDSSIDVYFNHYLRHTSNASANTDWKVTRTMSISGSTSGSAPKFTDLSNGGSGTNFATLNSPITGNLATSDTNEHSIPNSSTNRQIRIDIPNVTDNKDINYTVTICEKIEYQKDNSKSSAYDGWTKACAKFTVSFTPQPTITTVTCPLPYYTAPPVGTLMTGTTKSGSGIISNVFTNYATLIYAKPTDKVSWAHCYNPEAQAVRYTNDSHTEPTPTPEHDNYTCKTTHSYTDTTAGAQDDIVSTSNRAEITTTNTSAFTPGVGFTLAASDSTLYMSGSTLNGELGNRSPAVIYSLTKPISYKVNFGYAGTTVKQAVNTDAGTNTVQKDDSWSWSYSYTYLKWYTNNPSCGVQTAGGWDSASGQYIPPVYKSCYLSTGCYGSGSGYHTPPFYHIISRTSWQESSSASFYIPYNFTTEVSTNITQSLTDRANEEVVLAGESMTVSAKVSILPRQNNTTQGKYATEPPEDTKVEIVTFFLPESVSTPPRGSTAASTSSVCAYFGSSVGHCDTTSYGSRSAWMTSQPAYQTGGVYTLTVSRSADNVPAGYRICSAVGISHTDSLNDTNSYNANSGSYSVNPKWNISDPTCRSVAKNPSIQIWGGNLFTNGVVSTSSTTKRILNRTFGSWGELALIAGGTNGSIEGMGSAASLGYTSPYDQNTGKTGGNNSANFYTRTSLAIANSHCVGDSSSCTSIVNSGITSNSTIMDRLISRFISSAAGGANVSGNVNLASAYSTYNGYRLTRSGGDISITSAYTVPAGVTHILYSTGDVYIKANLTYTNASLTNLDQVPQLLIISDGGNIYIDPSVKRIDAWLIAERGSIDTCYNKEIGSNSLTGTVTTSAGSCGDELVINGPVIAWSLSAKRSFGAGAGESNNSYNLHFNDQTGVTSAELFNMTLSSYLWAYSQALKNPQPHTVYTRILAPRL